jgi:uncharacterized protein YjiK
MAGAAIGCAGIAAEDTARNGQRSIGLDEYRPHSKPGHVPAVEWNASGLTWNPETGTFFVVLNHPATIVEFDSDGKARRQISMHGFSDTEGIVHLEGHVFAVVEEGRGRISILDIEPGATRLGAADARVLPVEETGGNRGIEGIAYDPRAKVFYLVKEKGPRKIYKVDLNGAVSHPWDAETNSLGLRDLSDICFDPATGHLILLSHESKAAVECTVEGREISRMRVEMSKPEGITLTPDRDLHICGEPNDLQRFTRRP